jgi:NADH-quinone oxidoreductase subunit J
MDPKSIAFYAFALVLVFAALRVVTTRNPVHAALYLVLAFVTAAGIWILLQAEFLAITLVLVYVGAVMVLFLFVVMMLDINLDKIREGFWKSFPVAAVVGSIIIIELAYVIINTFDAKASAAPKMLPGTSNTKVLGTLIYTDYIYAVELAAVLLLIAIVAAIALTLRRRKDSRANDPSKAVKVKARDRLRIVKVDAISQRQQQPKP